VALLCPTAGGAFSQTATLTAVTAEIGATQAQLRQTHLKYHPAMMDVLLPDQVERYRELRGYGAPVPHPRSHH
jgi:hypothetical protein